MSSDVTWGWSAFFEYSFYLPVGSMVQQRRDMHLIYVIERLDMANQNLLHILNCFSRFQPQNPEENGLFNILVHLLLSCEHFVMNYPYNGSNI